MNFKTGRRRDVILKPAGSLLEDIGTNYAKKTSAEYLEVYAFVDCE